MVILSSGSFVTLSDRPERAALPVEPVDAADGVHAGARPVLAAHQRRARRLAVRAAGVAAGEPHPLRRQAVDVRRLVILAAVTGDVGVAEVVGEDEDDVGFARRVGGVDRCHGSRQQGGGESYENVSCCAVHWKGPSSHAGRQSPGSWQRRRPSPSL